MLDNTSDTEILKQKNSKKSLIKNILILLFVFLFSGFITIFLISCIPNDPQPFCSPQKQVNVSLDKKNRPIETTKVETTEVIITDKILPCPFCGEKAEAKESLFEYEAYVKCTKCDVSTDHYNCISYDEAKLQAIKAWNRRVD